MCLQRVGLTAHVLQQFHIENSKDRKSIPRHEFITGFLAAYVEKHLSHNKGKDQRYQIVLSRPKWNKSEIPDSVRAALLRPFNYERFFPEDDKLLEELSGEDFLHLPPDIPYLREWEYYQIVVIYPRSSRDWKYDTFKGQVSKSMGPLERFLTSFRLPILEENKYYNWPIFEEQLRKLLCALGAVHLSNDSIAVALKQKEFEVLSFRSSSESQSYIRN